MVSDTITISKNNFPDCIRTSKKNNYKITVKLVNPFDFEVWNETDTFSYKIEYYTGSSMRLIEFNKPIEKKIFSNET